MQTPVSPRPKRSFFQIALIAMVSLGIQVAMGLQIANISPIYQYLGASANLGVLWAAGPISGLVVQPLIGNASDRIWTRIGRRRPFMLIGTIVAVFALVFMPLSFAVWMAAVLLWALDLSINTTQEPVRALLADIVPRYQRTLAFSIQMMMFNLGAAIGMALPWVLHNVFGVTDRTTTGIPLSVHLGFWLGAVILVLTTIVTLFAGKERRPPDLDRIRAEAAKHKGVGQQFVEVWRAFRDMDRNLHRLAVVQFFTWFGFFTIVIYFTVAVANHVFGAFDPHTTAYVHGTQWGGLMMSLYSLVALAASIVFVTWLKHANPRKVHIVCLFLGGLGLLSAAFVTNKWLLIPSMVGVGIMWASVMSMPYSILANYAPEEKLGVYFGIFNIFITAPQLVLALGVSWIVHNVLGGADHALWMGGISLLLGAAFMFRVQRPPEREPGEAEVIEAEA
jgi:maltose/moltooligosaccharide transporter